MILNLKGAEANLPETGNGNNFSLSTCIKVNVTADVVITVRTADDVFVGNTTLVAPASGGTTYFIEKAYTDKIVASGTVKGTPVGFTIA